MSGLPSGFAGLWRLLKIKGRKNNNYNPAILGRFDKKNV
jgi:hypothetical protein